ncbi:MAG: protein jag [Firmicutes bacterium]|nr:protein jag [Bacillota bacterium]MBQ4092833.1 protein jag [Bacillota bacterium]MBQ6810085.1 protein jag [Bacillota bacterium]
MKTLEKSGKTIDEAIDAALAELGRSREDVTIEIVKMPSKGIFGIGAKDAVVRVSAEDSATAYAIEFLSNIFKKFELDVTIRAIEGEEFITLDLVGKDLGILIGRRGETLDALQYLTNLTVSRHFEDRNKFILDVEGYRSKREETLERLAKKLAERVKESGKNMSLEPMSPYERRIIHTVLQADEQVRTFSEGEEPYRKVVIAKKK